MALLQGKIALITGAARGIGRAIARCFADEGCHIALTDRVCPQDIDQNIDELAQNNVKVRFYKNDAAIFADVQGLIPQIVADFGQIDILVNNAGVTDDNLVMRMREEQWDNVLNGNLKSVFNFTHGVVPIMIRQRSGSIISISSIVGTRGNAGQANYAASKAGIVGFTRSLAKELGSRNIRVNAIAPGFIDTPMTSNLSDAVKQNFIDLVSLRRVGRAEEVASVALFLASDLASYVSGQIIGVDGAMR